MNRIKIEDLYDNLQNEITKDAYKQEEINNLWDEINELSELLKNMISREDYEIFDNCLIKESELNNLEKKKAFLYGYKLSNNLMIDSLRE